MPAFETVYEAMKGQIGFVGIDGSDSRNAAVAQLTKTGVTYPAGYDPHDDVYTAYHLIGRPTTFFVAADGHILGHHAGELTAQQLRGLLGKYFGSS
jgi:serine/threonine protein phosphatase PrpC